MEENKPKTNFFVELIRKIEDFDFEVFKKNRQSKKEEKKKKKEIEKEIKESEKTISDISQQRKSHIRLIFKRFILIGIIFLLVTAAVILSTQENPNQVRENINVNEVFNDKTSFGSIEEKDYFQEQNILNDRINNVIEKTDKDLEKIKTIIIEESNKTRESTKDALLDLEKKQTTLLKRELKATKTEIMEEVDKKIDTIKEKQSLLEKDLKEVKSRKSTPNIKLSNGKIVFPDLNKKKKESARRIASSPQDIKEEILEIEEDVYYEEEVLINVKTDLKTNFQTSSFVNKKEKKFKPFKVHLTTSMAKVTLLEGVKAAVSFAGLSEPSPVLMIIEDVLYTANDTVADLRGCFLRGVGVGNINTSRVEIFGTHLSCIIVADNGKKYKIEHTFPKNKVWIKGEDGGTGVQGQIVDSSGKLLAKGAAIGFMQGLSNFFLSQATTTVPTTNDDGTVAYTQVLNNSIRNGVISGIGNGFELAIKKYEQILEGYYPFIDTKGGRKGLTAVFGGEMELEIQEYNEPNIGKLRANNLSRGFE